MKTSIRRVVAGTLVLAALVLTGCQTVKGVGKDIQYAGEKTEQAIEKAK